MKINIFLALALSIVARHSLAQEPNKEALQVPTGAFIETIAGHATVPAQIGGEAKELSEGDLVPDGTTLHTSAGEVVRVGYSNGTQVTLGGDTEARMDEESGVPLWDLVKGIFAAKVEKKVPASEDHRFLVKTKTAVAGVRGTQFYVEQNDASESSIHTMEGVVEVAKDRSELKKGTGEKVAMNMQVKAVRSGISKPETFDRQAFMAELRTRHPFLSKVLKKPARSWQVVSEQRRQRLERAERKQNRSDRTENRRDRKERRRGHH